MLYLFALTVDWKFIFFVRPKKKVFTTPVTGQVPGPTSARRISCNTLNSSRKKKSPAKVEMELLKIEIELASKSKVKCIENLLFESIILMS